MKPIKTLNMNRVKRFEDVEIWKLSRLLCKDIFQITVQKAFSKDFAIKDQIRYSSGSIMNYMPKILNGTVVKSLLNSSQYPRAHVVNAGHNSTNHSIVIILPMTCFEAFSKIDRFGTQNIKSHNLPEAFRN